MKLHTPGARPNGPKTSPWAPSRSKGRAALLGGTLATLLLAGVTACRTQTTPESPATPPGAATTELSSATSQPSGAAPTPTLASVALATEKAQEKLPLFVRQIGTSGDGPGELRLPFDVAVNPNGSLWVSDSKGVQLLDAGGSLLVQLDPELVPEARGIDSADDGTVYVTGHGAQVLVFGPDGASKGTLGEAGEGPGRLADPKAVAVGPDGDIYVADSGNARVEKYAPDGTHLLTVGEPGTGRGQFTRPWSVEVDDAGRIYVSTGDSYQIQRFDPAGNYLDVLGQSHADENLWQIAGLSISDQGVLYALQVTYNRVQAFDIAQSPATFLWEFGEVGHGPMQFSSPSGADVSGDLLYVADTSNDRISVFQMK